MRCLTPFDVSSDSHILRVSRICWIQLNNQIQCLLLIGFLAGSPHSPHGASADQEVWGKGSGVS